MREEIVGTNKSENPGSKFEDHFSYIENFIKRIEESDSNLELRLANYISFRKELKAELSQILDALNPDVKDMTDKEKYLNKANDQKKASETEAVREILRYFSLDHLIDDEEIEGMIPNLCFILERGKGDSPSKILVYRKEEDKYYPIVHDGHWIEIGRENFNDAVVHQQQAAELMNFLNNHPEFDTNDSDLLLAMRRILISTDPIKGVNYYAVSNPSGVTPAVRLKEPLIIISDSLDLGLKPNEEKADIVGLSPINIDIIPFEDLKLARKNVDEEFHADMSPADILAMYHKNAVLEKRESIRQRVENILEYFLRKYPIPGYFSQKKRSEVLNELNKELIGLLEEIEEEAVNTTPAWLPVDPEILIEDLAKNHGFTDCQTNRNVTSPPEEHEYTLERRAYTQKIINALELATNTHVDIQVVGTKGAGKSTIILKAIEKYIRDNPNICLIEIDGNLVEKIGIIESQIKDFIEEHGAKEATLVIYANNSKSFDLKFTIQSVKNANEFARTITIREKMKTDGDSFLSSYSFVAKIPPLSPLEIKLLSIKSFTGTFLDQIYKPNEKWSLVGAMNALGSYLIPESKQGESLENVIKLYSLFLGQQSIDMNEINQFIRFLEKKDVNLLKLSSYGDEIRQCMKLDDFHRVDPQWITVFDYLHKKLEENNDPILQFYEEFKKAKVAAN